MAAATVNMRRVLMSSGSVTLAGFHAQNAASLQNAVFDKAPRIALPLSAGSLAFPLRPGQTLADGAPADPSAHRCNLFRWTAFTNKMVSLVVPSLRTLHAPTRRQVAPVRAMSSGSDGEGGGRHLPSRLAQKQQLLDQKTEEFTVEDEGPIPKISEDYVTVSFARSGGAGGQNVNKVNTKVDMRFSVRNAEWLPERVRRNILEQEKNRINSDGELVVSSTRTRTQKGNIQDALQKIQGIIEKASYVPPPPSDEKKARIKKLAKADNERRLDQKKKQSSKKGDRRNKGKWD